MEPRKYCVVCGTIYRHELRTCPEDGSQLVIEAEQGERLRLGHVLGSYRLIRKLGEGGVGTVYEGEHIRLGRKMALKVLHPETASAEVIVRFFNEARAVNQIRHPNIVDVEDFVTAETGEHYLIMEMLQGEDLRSVISREGVMDPARVAILGEQMASALAAVHRCGIIHRDLKPDNIFLSRDKNGNETAKLLDFGIAKFLTDGEGMTREGITLGTPEYMAPEQIITTGKPGPRADIYALGMLMYECVAGAPAFTATTTAAILRGHISEPIVPPSHRRGEPLPPVLEAAILKCLEKDPANRFSDGEALAAALRSDRAVQLVTPRFDPEKAAKRSASKSRALQMLPAFAMAAAALALHFAPRSDEKATAATPVVKPVVQQAAAPVEPPPAPAEGEPAPPATHIQVALSSHPEGAELFLGDKSLGVAPTLADIPIGSDPVTLTAKFPDGASVVQSIVPDRPLPHIAFTKPTKRPVVESITKQSPRTKASPSTATKRPTSSGTIEDRDGTMDPFK